MNAYIRTPSVDPYYNLALEEYIFDCCDGRADGFPADGCTLYLWQNQNTVVIGRNQNAWRECRIAALESDGGHLARRTSGGGAVFHDVGNLNFTFTAPKALYDEKRQLVVIIDAVRTLGIEAGFTGRNDIVTKNGAKFSGNAYRHSALTSMHHGTILVNVDMARLSAYLAPSKEKLKAKGVQSVRSRVCNLSEYAPGLTVEAMAASVLASFGREYGEYVTVDEAALDASRLFAARTRHESWEWRLGASPAFDIELHDRFEWGEVQLLFSLSHGVISTATVYSDAMNEAFIRSLPELFRGVRFTAAALGSAASRGGCAEARELGAWLSGLEL